MSTPSAAVQRTADDQEGVNTLVVLMYPLRFQIAPGAAAGLGISGADYTISFGGAEIGSGTTDATGEVPVPLVHLMMGSVTVHILGTDYDVSFKPLADSAKLAGSQQRMDMLGYISGYQLAPSGSDVPDDGLDGPRTQQSIMNFQCDENLSLDGVIGNQTRDKLKSRTSL